MSGFSFPPPPPPPPKSNGTEQQSVPQRGGYGQGRGSRGNFQHRGRGHAGAGREQGPNQQGRAQSCHNATANSLPSSTAADRYGSGSHGTFGLSSPNAKGTQSNDGRQGKGSPPRTAAGHKRKLDALRGPPQRKPENKSGPATAPAVPTFGASILPSFSSTAKISPPVRSTDQSKPSPPARSLGLTPATGDPQYSSSDSGDDERDLDEESMYAELGDKLTFEHNGVVMSLNSQADLLQWKRDRQKKWPTKARMATKDEERRRIGEERKRLLAGGSLLYRNGARFAEPGSNIWTSSTVADDNQALEADGLEAKAELTKPETDLEKAKREIAEKTKRLEELRRKVTESEARNRRAREAAEQRPTQPNSVAEAVSPNAVQARTGATSAEVETAVANDAGGTATHNPIVSYGESSDSSSSSSSEDASDQEEQDSNDEPPEETTSKPPAAPEHTPTDKQSPVCRYFAASGWCRDGDACRFRHDALTSAQEQERSREHGQRQGFKQGHIRKDERAPRLQQPSEKKTIFQRLVEQEEEADDRLALKLVKYLGEAGFFRS